MAAFVGQASRHLSRRGRGGKAQAPKSVVFQGQEFCRSWESSWSLVPRASSYANFMVSSSSSTLSSECIDDDSVRDEQAAAALKAAREERKQKRREAKEKRRRFIGMAKAVDRGQSAEMYMPGGQDGKTFVAKSGLPDTSKTFTVLGIESSCDDTGAAVVRSDGVILGESLASQNDIHEEWGGIVPNLARTAHEENIEGVISKALHQAGMSSPQEVDAIAVTVGPGLEICLRVGCNRARELALQHDKPFVAVHHLEAHILMARLSAVASLEEQPVEFPFLALLVSGGHCQILKCMGIGRYKVLGGTIDDSLGEAFDKTARMLGLLVGGGGGPAVEQLARDGDPLSIPLTVPLQHRKDCDFSYAGLKTAVRTAAEKQCRAQGLHEVSEMTHQDKANLAASFQHIAIRHVEERLGRAMTLMENENKNDDTDIRCLVVVGGVAANMELRSRLQALCDQRSEPWSMAVPPPRLCTDQGTMTAWAAIERIRVGSSDEPQGQEVFARYPLRYTS